MFVVGIGPDLAGADWLLESTGELEYASLVERFRAHHARHGSDASSSAAPGEADSGG